MPSRISKLDCSFSDHEAVAANIKLTQNPVTKPNKSEFRKNLKSEEKRNEIDKAVKDAIEIMDKSLESVEQSSFLYLTFFILTCVFSSLILYFQNFEIYISFISIILLAIFLSLFLAVAILFNEREKNAFISTKKELKLLLSSGRNKVLQISAEDL